MKTDKQDRMLNGENKPELRAHGISGLAWCREQSMKNTDSYFTNGRPAGS